MPETPVDAQSLAVMSLDWLMSSAQQGESGLLWKAVPSNAEPDDTLYSGSAGIVLALLEGYHHFGDERYAIAAARGASTIARTMGHWDDSSLYFGLSGMAVALHAVHEQLGEQLAGDAVKIAAKQIRARFDGERWSGEFELLAGNAGIALGALSVGDLELALLAVTPYLRTAERTAHGVQWEDRAGESSRLHHISHGTLGIVSSLAAVGGACGQPELTALALAGAADVVARNESDATGFLVPHSDPQYRPDRVERFSYGWCHGPAGDAQVFRQLAKVTGDIGWSSLADRCWDTIIGSGLPQQLRPGFWDNSGRCCGTAGVLALACDRFVEHDQDMDFARVLVDDLASRATIDADGARWSNVEHRATPSMLEPETGWASGNAGIVRELLRFARIVAGQDPAYSTAWPDQPSAVRPRRQV